MKTKKMILLLSAILLTIVGNAQEAAQFQIDDTHCLLLDNYCANCEL